MKTMGPLQTILFKYRSNLEAKMASTPRGVIGVHVDRTVMLKTATAQALVRPSGGDKPADL